MPQQSFKNIYEHTPLKEEAHGRQFATVLGEQALGGGRTIFEHFCVRDRVRHIL